VGLVLDQKKVFAHGQLYVAASRVRTRKNLRILLPPGATKVDNVVQQRIVGAADIKTAKEHWVKEENNCACFLLLPFNFMFSLLVGG